MNTEYDYLIDCVNQLEITDFRQYNPDDLGIGDVMCDWLVKYKMDRNQNTDDVEDLIGQHFDDVVVAMYNRCNDLGIVFHNRLSDQYWEYLKAKFV